jgi:hypothetical protein
MKPRTLITRHLYFGMEAERLRDASGRVLSRVVGLPPERARVRTEHLKQDFHVDTVEGKALVDEFVAEGLLQPRAERKGDYYLTERFVEIAAARIVEPLPRARAKYLVDQASELAGRINAEGNRNPLEIDSVVAFGSYMSLDETLAELDLAVIVRSRGPGRRTRWKRMATKPEGAGEIKAAFRELSSFVHVQIMKDMRLLPRPFAVVFQDP